MGQIQELNHLIRTGSHFFFLAAHLTGHKPGFPQGLPRLIRGYRHQVFPNGQMGEFMGNLEGPQQALPEKVMRCKPGHVFPIQKDFTR